MGVLTDIVIADESEAREVAHAPVPAQRWTGIDAKGIDHVKLATLWALLENRTLDVDQTIREFASLYDVSDEGPWVFRIPEPLVRQLAAIDDQRAAAIADAWAGTEEFILDEWDRDSVRSILDDLRGLARDAAAQEKSLLMWSCL